MVYKRKIAAAVLDEWSSRLLHEVKLQIRAIKERPSFRFHSKSEKILDDNDVKSYLSELHEKFVITPTDKAGNNFSVVCKKFYIQCLLKELCLSKDSKKKKSTYENLKIKQSNVVKRHVQYMS